jgi:hypothetical protein
VPRDSGALIANKDRLPVRIFKETAMIRYVLSIATVACVVGCTEADVLHDTNSGPATNGPLTNRDLSTPRASSSPPPVVVAAPQPVVTYRTGTGVVESVQRVGPAPSASAGASSVPAAAYRLTVRMDDGSVQVIDENSRDFRAGDRIRITTDGQIVGL